MNTRSLFAVALLGVAIVATPNAFAQAAGGTLAKIKAAKAINVAYSPDSLPFSMRTASGDAAGYSIDICKRVIAQIGRTVGDTGLKVNWIPGSVSERLQMIASGRADLECGNTTVTQSRLASVDFSGLIFVDSGGFLIKQNSSVKGATDLGGKKIAVLKGTTTETRLNEVLRTRLVNATIVPIAAAEEGIAMLEAGTADAYAGDKIKLVGLVATSKDPSLFVLLGDDLSLEPYALALPRNDSDFRLEVNKALTQVYATSDIEQIFAQNLGRLGRPSGLLAAMYLLYAIPQ